MSSARKRQKAKRIADMLDHANQQATLANHHANMMSAMVEEIARKHDRLVNWNNHASAVLARFVTLGSDPKEEEWGLVALDATRLLNTPPNV